MIDGQSHILEKVLEGAKLTSLNEPAEGQICVIQLGSSCARVVIDKIFNDGRVGVHGLDQVIFKSLVCSLFKSFQSRSITRLFQTSAGFFICRAHS